MLTPQVEKKTDNTALNILGWKKNFIDLMLCKTKKEKLKKKKKFTLLLMFSSFSITCFLHPYGIVVKQTDLFHGGITSNLKQLMCKVIRFVCSFF